MAIIKDIVPPDDPRHGRDFITASFSLAIDELKIIEDGLNLLLKTGLSSAKLAKIISLGKGIGYARHKLQTEIDGIIREHGEV